MPHTILVDIDDTIADTMPAILDYVNQRSDTPLAYHQLTRQHREDNQTDHRRLVQEFLAKPDLVAAAPPYADAKQALQQLHEAGYAIHIASARREPLHQTSVDWLTEHGLADYVSRIHARMSDQRGTEFKCTVAKQIQAVAAFDDTFNVAEALAEAGTAVYLIDRPWNTGPVPEHVTRVASFAEGVELFLKN